ncbi:hypothetical protein ILUMI_20410 [Ignelater luminosus]|uniref:Serine palmitoyltransferase 1 n=1 Tax=Ignelater luminosus TaxID=2038154 RepID=A0A8K0CKZ2_IGNLU|nr:hypothetical protein ILUMI_20410 [Ignelater luminosus]
MLNEILQSTNVGTVVPASLVIFLTFIMLRKTKSYKKAINVNQNDRIYCFKPQPLIDFTRINLNEALEIPAPDESDPDCMNLAKVNYLDLLNNINLRKEAESCIRIYGVGSCGPRGFYGTIDIHLTLESRLAEFMGMEETVLYSYGFSTISSAIGAYCKKSDIIFCDEKISFCAGQGILAAKSKVVYFKHNDMEDLNTKLQEYEEKEKQRKKLYRKFLVVEGIYAATGTICPLPELMSLRKKYKLRIFIDESLSFGVLGKTGRGVTEHFNVNRSDIDMIMGSLEGSIGSIGGFCVGASVVIEHQRLSGLGYCFSASLPPFLSHISICALDMFEKDPSMFEKLKSIVQIVDERLRNLKGIMVISDPLSPHKVITTTNIENREETIKKIHAACVQKDIYLICLKENLHFNLNVTMKDADIDRFINTLQEAVGNILCS